MRGGLARAGIPDFAALRPGYETIKRSVQATQNSRA
jgi:hypothetical protein